MDCVRAASGPPQLISPFSLKLQNQFHFVEPLENKHRCNKCGMCLTPPVCQSECGHRFCSSCKEMLLSQPNGSICPVNEIGCVRLTRNNVYQDRGTDRELIKLKVYCKNHPECQQITQWKELDNHLQECKYNKIACPYYKKGCTEMFLPKHKQVHIEEGCLYRPFMCKFCQNEMPVRNKDSHLRKCGDEETACEFKNEGCTFTGKRRDMKDHICAKQVQHLTMVRRRDETRRDQLQDEVNELSTKVHGLENSFSELKGNVSCLNSHLHKVRQHIQPQDHTNSEEVSLMPIQVKGEANTTLDEELDGIKIPIENSSLTTEAKQVSFSRGNKANSPNRVTINGERSLLVNQNEIDKSDSDGSGRNKPEAMQNSLCPSGIKEQHKPKSANLPTKVLEHGDASLELEKAVRTDNKTTDSDASHEYVINEGQRTEAIVIPLVKKEPGFVCGSLFPWRINNFAMRKKLAEENPSQYLESEPFYTGDFGYKMCLRMYLNGHGPAKDTHISFYFVIMKGTFDQFLPWPFRQKVKLILLDQENNDKCASDTFNPDPTNASFQKPVGNMNPGAGSTYWMPQSLLEQNNYVKNDTLCVLAQVDNCIRF